MRPLVISFQLVVYMLTTLAIAFCTCMFSMIVFLTVACDALQLHGAVPEVHRVRDPHHRVRLHILSRRLLTWALFPHEGAIETEPSLHRSFIAVSLMALLSLLCPL